MSNTLYIVVSSRLTPGGSGITLGLLTYNYPDVLTSSPSNQFFQYGASNNSSATPYPIFTDAASARAFFDPTVGPLLLSAANSTLGAGYYSAYSISAVDEPAQLAINALSSTIPPAQINSDWNASSGVAMIQNKPSIPTIQTFDGTTQRLNAFQYTSSAVAASGTVAFNLTTNGLSGGTAIFPTGPIANSVQMMVNDATAAYQLSGIWSNGNKTFTITVNKLSSVINLLTGVLGQTPGNGATVYFSVWGY